MENSKVDPVVNSLKMNNTYAAFAINSIFTSEAIHQFDIQHELYGIEKIVNHIRKLGESMLNEQQPNDMVMTVTVNEHDEFEFCVFGKSKPFRVGRFPFVEYFERLEFAARTPGSLDFNAIMAAMRRDVQNDEVNAAILFWRQHMEALRHAFEFYLKPWVPMTTIERLIDVVIAAYRFDDEFFARLRYQKKQRERQEMFLASMEHVAFEDQYEQIFINSLPSSPAVEIQTGGL